MRIYEPLAFIQRMLEENMLHAAENVFLNWNIIRGITLTHAFMKIQETTGTTETPLSKTSGNTLIYKGSENGNGSASKPIVAGGAHLIQGDPLLPQYHPHRLSELPEMPNEEFTASPLREAVV